MKIIDGQRPGELDIGIVLLVFSVCAFWKSYAIEGFSSLTSSGVFPMLASGVMIISGIFILAKTARLPKSQENSETSAIGYLLPAKFVVFVPMMIAFAAAMPWVGFFPSAAGFIFIAISFLWRKNVIRTIFITLLSVCAIYVIFRLLFKVVLPTGVLWQ